MASEQSWSEGVIPWMSPERLYPGRFGLKDNLPTVKSDLYALGMVIYEVLSGQAPFAAYKDPEVVFMVLGGERPERPKEDAGELFRDKIWEVVEHCWKQQPSDRPTANRVLIGFEGDLSMSGPPSDMDGEVETDVDDESWAASIESGPGESGTGTFSLSNSNTVFTHPRAIIGPSVAGGSDGITDPPQKHPPKCGRVRSALNRLLRPWRVWGCIAY